MLKFTKEIGDRIHADYYLESGAHGLLSSIYVKIIYLT